MTGSMGKVFYSSQISVNTLKFFHIAFKIQCKIRDIIVRFSCSVKTDKPCVLSPGGEKLVCLCVPEKVSNKENKQTLVQFQHMLTIAKLFLIYHCTI